MATVDPFDQLQEEVAREVLALLEALRREVLGAIVAAPEPLATALRGLVAEIEAASAQTERQLQAVLAGAVRRAAELGDAAAVAEVQQALPDVRAYVGVSETLLRVAGAYVSELVADLAADARARITRELRLAALGGTSTTALIARIGVSLDTPGTFRSIAARAEAIARTEVSRIRNMAHAEQSQELAQRVPGLRKVWEHASSSPGFSPHQRRMSRPGHVRLAARTARAPIPVGSPFRLGPYRPMYPHDPGLPTDEVLHCRCRVRLVVPATEAD